MATEDNLRDRAKEIRGAFEPSSVTNEAVGGLLLDIINFFIDYGGNGGGGGKPDARYWSKEELVVLDQYLYILKDKVKALYADSAGDSELFKGHKWEDYFDQPVRTSDPVEFKSVTSNEDNWHITDKGDAKFRDVIGKVITITDRLMTDNFVAGMTGTGVGVVNKAEVHMDKGVIRKYLEVLALVVAQIFYRGGRQVLSPAGMKINKVEEFDGYWRCYMETEDGQVNEFTVGAQARCNRYGSQQRYWWRLVDNIGVDYIDVSKTDMDAGSMAPAVGDEVVQFGHRTDPYLQWVVMDSSFSDDAGRTIYAGVNSYDLSGKWVLREGVSPTDPSRIGLFTRHGEFSDVIDGINQDIQDNQQAIQDTKDAADAIQSVVDNLTGIIIPDMQNQLDGAIQSWDGEVEPTLNNYPANEWFDEETGRDERAKHVGDTYIYYTTDSEGNTVSSRYNFRFVDGVYKWELIADSVSAELEVKLRELTGTVGKKNSITYSNNVPTPAYNIDDLWIKEDGSMYICRAQKMEGMQGSAADWELFNDTMLRLVQIASDNVISVEEKPSLRDTWSQIQKEFTKYQADATTYGVSITNLQNAYNALGSFLTNTVKLAQDVDTSLTVSQKADYNQKFADYYSRRTEFSNIVSQKIADESVGNLQIGGVNLLNGTDYVVNKEAWGTLPVVQEENGVKFVRSGYSWNFHQRVKGLKNGKEYTISGLFRASTDKYSARFALDQVQNVVIGNVTNEWQRLEATFTYTGNNDSQLVYILTNGNANDGKTIDFANLQIEEGNKATAWKYSQEDQRIIAREQGQDVVNGMQIGMVNLLKGSNVELNRQNYNIGRYYWDKIPETGKTYTLVVCYTLGTNNTYISAYSNVNTGSVIKNFSTHGDKVVESHTFTPSREFGDSIAFYQFPNDGTYGSKVHWAVLVEGNKGPNAWIPSLSEQGETAAKDAVDNLQIGSVNLVSRKMMLAWNEKNKDIAVWGQDSDGIYLGINQKALYNYVCGGAAHNDLFGGTIKYKDNTQYVFQVKWKLAGEQTNNNSGVSFWALYTDGTSDAIQLRSLQTSLIVESFITKKGKTVEKIYSSYGTNTYRSLIYSLALYEGNKVLAEPPVATEDLTGQSNVNLVDGGKEVIVPARTDSDTSANYNYKVLTIPKLKHNTVYNLSFKAENLAGTPSLYSSNIYNGNGEYVTFLNSSSGGVIIIPNNFQDGRAMIYLYAGLSGGTKGNSVKFTDVILVEGFTPPSSYSPSPGDIDQAIQDAIAKTVDITAPSQVFKYGPGYTGTPTPSSIVLTATPRNFTPTSYQWQFLNGSTWINITIDGASSTYSVNPNSTTLFPSGTNVRTFRCICNGDEKLSDSFTLAKLADGATGQPGADGRGVKSTAVTYQSSTSGTTVPTGTWSASIPAVAAGSYLWTKTVITYTSGDPSTMYSVARMGTNGTNGNNGNGVSSTVITYQASTSGTTAPTGTWGSTIPSVPAGQYLWTRTVINYTNGSSSTIYSVGMTGKTGADGKDAYTILLGNESHAFAGSTAAALAGSTTCSVVAYKGATRVAATIGTISGLPTGMTASVASNGTTTPVITFTVTTSMTTASGTVNIPVTVDGKTFTKVFSYSIAFRGDPGESINGKMLYKDPEFKKGLNGVEKYTNSSNVSPDYIASKLTVERVTKPSDAPTQSGYCLKVTCKAAQSPGYGGVVQSIQSRANAVFMQKIIAKIPVGYKINTASNSMGTGYTDTWLTPTEGTGKYTTYLRKVVCGATGTFSAGGHVYITGNPAPTEAKPLEWYIAYMTAFDLTADGYGDIESVTKDDFASQLGFADFDALVANAITKGPLIKAGYINADLIETDKLVVNDAFVNNIVSNQAFISKLDGYEFNFKKGTAGGFKMESTLLYSGAKFGTGGAGIAMQSMTNNYGFNVYKDNNNYMEMFQRSSEWGLKGVVGGNTILQLGSTNKIGGFDITDDRIGSIFGTGGVGNGMSLYDFVVKFKSDNSGDSRFAALGTSVYPSSTAQSTLLRLEETRSGNLDNILSYFYCSGASGVLDSRNIAIKVGKGDVDIDNGNLNMAAGNFMKMKGQIHFDNVITYTGSGAVTITADSGHFIYLTPITGNPVVSVSSGLPIGSWFIIAHATTAGGYYYIKLSGSDRFRRRGNAYQQVNSHNQDPSLIFKVNNTTWIIGNLPVNWIDWN